jgi:hypothetical protein
MDHREAILTRSQAPAEMESYYRDLTRSEAKAFAAAMAELYTTSPDVPLIAAWHHRLRPQERHPDVVRRWGFALVIGILTGLALWGLWPRGYVFGELSEVAALPTWGAAVVAAGVVAYLGLAGRRLAVAGLAALAGLAGCAAYVWFVARPDGTPMEQQYATLAYIHLPLLAYAAVALATLGWRSGARPRFAFLSKTVEVVFTGGVFAVVGGLFYGVTLGLFATLDIAWPIWLEQMVAMVGAGALPVLAVATVYDPSRAPEEQAFEVGLGRVVGILMRLLLPLALLVLGGYLVAIPFRFMEPFLQRDVLIVYNVLLFAVVGLLIAVIPLEWEPDDRMQRTLRTGIAALAGLTVLVSLYALAAVVTRTIWDGWTLNRLTVIGWNVLNTGALALLEVRLARAWREDWVASAQAAIRLGSAAYLVWGLVVILLLPWLF